MSVTRCRVLTATSLELLSLPQQRVAAHWLGGVPLAPAVLVVGSCAVLYACLMLRTGSLPFVVAFHVANNWVQDALLRTSDGSIWRTLYLDAPSGPSAGAPIWMCMAAINLAAAGVALGIWVRRGRLSTP